jgi:kinetochore protein Nuf2
MDIENNKGLYREILEFLSEMCVGVTKDEMAQPAFNGLQVFNNYELHEESIPILHAFRAVNKMMNICGIPDFSIKDYMVPSAKRFRRQLSGIINYAKFREERFTLLVDVSKDRERLIEALNMKRAEQENLKAYIAQVQAEVAASMEEEVSAVSCVLCPVPCVFCVLYISCAIYALCALHVRYTLSMHKH